MFTNFNDTITMSNGHVVNMNNMCSARYKGGSTSSTTASKQEKETYQMIIDWVSPYLNKNEAGQSYNGQLVADMPGAINDAYGKFTGGQYDSSIDSLTRDVLAGKPAISFDPTESTNRWQSTFAEPLMESFRKTMAPIYKEQMNAPGVLYGRGTTDYVGNRAEDFFTKNVQPTLYQSVEAQKARADQSQQNAWDMRSQGMNIPYNQFLQQAQAGGMMQSFAQQPLSAAYGEFQRTNPLQYAQLLGGLNFTPNQYASEGGDSSGMGAALGMGAMMLGGAMFPPLAGVAGSGFMGGMSMGNLGLMGAGLGGGVGSMFP